MRSLPQKEYRGLEECDRELIEQRKATLRRLKIEHKHQVLPAEEYARAGLALDSGEARRAISGAKQQLILDAAAELEAAGERITCSRIAAKLGMLDEAGRRVVANAIRRLTSTGRFPHRLDHGGTWGVRHK